MKFCMVGGLQMIVLRFRFHQNWVSGFAAVRCRNLPIPIALVSAYTTACTTIQAVNFGAFCPGRDFARYKIHFMSRFYILLYWQRYCTALQQQVSAKLCGMVQGMELRNFRRRHHLYSAVQPSRWASAHILVKWHFCIRNDLSLYSAQADQGMSVSA